MTTTQERGRTATTFGAVPDVLTEEHHEVNTAPGQVTGHQREAPGPPAQVTSHRPLHVGLLVGAVGLAAGFGAGYWVYSQSAETTAPFVITRQAGPVDANGQTLGRRVAPFDTMAPTQVPVGAIAQAVHGGRP